MPRRLLALLPTFALLSFSLPAPAHAANLLNLHQSFTRPLPAAAPHNPGLPGGTVSAASRATALKALTGLSASQVTSARACPVPAPGHASCQARVLTLRTGGNVVRPHVRSQRALAQTHPASGGLPADGSLGQAAPQYGTPAYLQQAYDLTYLSATKGGSDTIAIVDAGDDPTAEADLDVFRAEYGLPACTTANGCFAKVNENGQTSPLPAPVSGWQIEESLDLDAVSSLCPNCHIVLAEASSSNLTDLQAAMAAGVSLGASQLSDSWSGTASAPLPGTFTWPGVATIAATGDQGYLGTTGDNYPAAFPGVTAAGGTSLTATTSPGSARGFDEAAWSGAGSGCDTAEAKPSWQTDTGCTGRSYADVSADADPNTGLGVYDSGDNGWILVGGTSLATPLISAYEAVTSVNGDTPQWAYTDSGLLNDPQTGQNGTCATAIAYICDAGTGYDGPTGMGSISGAVSTGAPGVGAPAQSSATSYVSTLNASVVSLLGGVYPNGQDTTDYWQYGTTSAYGQQSSSVDVGSGVAPVQSAGTLTGLAASTTYHYRLVAQNLAGVTDGYDHTFTTPATGSPPQSTAAPAVTGTAVQGQTLTATPGNWNPSETPTYQWERDTESGWAPIPGATTSSYLLTAADIGAQVKMSVSETDSYGPASTASSAPVGPVVSGAPLNTAAPVLSGAAAQAQTLTVSDGTWTRPGTVSYQWQRNTGSGWLPISGATTSSYTLTNADIGGQIEALVIETNTYGPTAAASAPDGPVMSAAPQNTTAPALSGIAKQGQTLTVTDGTWTRPGTVSYQWQRNTGPGWLPISGATTSSYTLRNADVGAQIEALVTETNTYGPTAAASDGAGPVTALVPPQNTTSPTLSGVAQSNATLTAAAGAWSPSGTVAYQWQSSPDGTTFADIPGQTSASYALSTADVGAYVRVLVTETNTDGSASAASDTRGPVLAAPVNLTVPAVTGIAKSGQVLTASAGAWTAVGTLSYQWERNTGSGWLPVAGATASTYTLAAADVGAEFEVIVTDTTAASASATSALLGPVAALAPPLSNAPPVLTGVAERGQTLTVSAGVWSPSGVVTYQWERYAGSEWLPVAGATASTYTLSTADAGADIQVRVTATNSDGQATVPSNTLGPVPVFAPPQDGVLPSVTGSVELGQVLNAAPGVWTPSGAVSYQWERYTGSGWLPIAGATAPTYTLSAADVGTDIHVRVTETNADGQTSAVSSATAAVTGAAAAPVTAPAPAVRSAPKLAGGLAVGATVKLTGGAYSNVTAVGVQFERCAQTCTADGRPSSGAYRVTGADAGYYLRAQVTLTGPGGTRIVWAQGEPGPVRGPNASVLTLSPGRRGTVRSTAGHALALAAAGNAGRVVKVTFARPAKLNGAVSVRACVLRDGAPVSCTALRALSSGTARFTVLWSAGERLQLIVLKR